MEEQSQSVDSSDLPTDARSDQLKITDSYAFKLLETATAYSQSLNAEFAPSADSVADWQHSIMLLEQSVSPLTRWINQLSQQGGPNLEWRPALLNEIESAIQASVRSFHVHGKKPSEGLSNGATSLRRAVEGLRIWQECSHTEQVERDIVLPVGHELLKISKVRWLLDDSFCKLQNVVQLDLCDSDNAGRISQCMASRKLYIVGYFVSCVCPDLWTGEQYTNFVSLHEELLKNMNGASHFRASIRARLYRASISPILNPGSQRAAA